MFVFLPFALSFKHPFSVQINKNNMFEIIGNKKPVFVHFYSPDCPHCVDFAPVWNELSRMYNIFDNITFATVNCDRYRSICSQFDGTSTPTTKFFAARSKEGERFGGESSIIGFAKFVRRNLGFNPYTAPHHLCYAKSGEVEKLLEKNAVLVVVDNHKKSTFNQTEIRECEEKRNVDIRAFDPVDNAKEAVKYCPDGKPCITLLQDDKTYKYEGKINKTEIIKFLDENIAEEL